MLKAICVLCLALHAYGDELADETAQIQRGPPVPILPVDWKQPMGKDHQYELEQALNAMKNRKPEKPEFETEHSRWGAVEKDHIMDRYLMDKRGNGADVSNHYANVIEDFWSKNGNAEKENHESSRFYWGGNAPGKKDQEIIKDVDRTPWYAPDGHGAPPFGDLADRDGHKDPEAHNFGELAFIPKKGESALDQHERFFSTKGWGNYYGTKHQAQGVWTKPKKGYEAKRKTVEYTSNPSEEFEAGVAMGQHKHRQWLKENGDEIQYSSMLPGDAGHNVEMISSIGGEKEHRDSNKRNVPLEVVAAEKAGVAEYLYTVSGQREKDEEKAWEDAEAAKKEHARNMEEYQSSRAQKEDSTIQNWLLEKEKYIAQKNQNDKLKDQQDRFYAQQAKKEKAAKMYGLDKPKKDVVEKEQDFEPIERPNVQELHQAKRVTAAKSSSDSDDSSIVDKVNYKIQDWVQAKKKRAEDKAEAKAAALEQAEFEKANPKRHHEDGPGKDPVIMEPPRDKSPGGREV